MEPRAHAQQRQEKLLELYAERESIRFDFQSDLKHKLPRIAEGGGERLSKDTDTKYVLLLCFCCDIVHLLRLGTHPLRALDRRVSRTFREGGAGHVERRVIIRPLSLTAGLGRMPFERAPPEVLPTREIRPLSLICSQVRLGRACFGQGPL